MKRSASFLLALMMLFSLAACGEGGLNLNPKDNDTDGLQEGYIGDTMSTQWFDFTVVDAYSCTEYGGHTPDAGNKLVVVTMTLKNTFGKSVDMWGDDFVILWDTEDDDYYYDIPLGAGLSEDQFPDEYTLGINATKNGVSVFEVPEEFQDFAIGFVEIAEDPNDPDNPEGIEGDTFFVYFTAEEK